MFIESYKFIALSAALKGKDEYDAEINTIWNVLNPYGETNNFKVVDFVEFVKKNFDFFDEVVIANEYKKEILYDFSNVAALLKYNKVLCEAIKKIIDKKINIFLRMHNLLVSSNKTEIKTHKEALQHLEQFGAQFVNSKIIPAIYSVLEEYILHCTDIRELEKFEQSIDFLLNIYLIKQKRAWPELY